MNMTPYETQIAQAYFNALENLVGAKSTDPRSKDKAAVLCDNACNLYESNLVTFADEGDFASFIDLCEEEIAQW